MEGWEIGLIALMSIGVAVILFGALWDRAHNQRQARELLEPPARDIPQFRPDAPAPQYLTELQARHSADEDHIEPRLRERVRAAMEHHEPLPFGYPDPGFANDTETGWAVCPEARVLLCGEPVESLRELLPALELASVTARPLVIAAPDVEPSVLATLAVNRIQHRLALLAVRAPDEARQAIAEACACVPVKRVDLQAGYLPESAYGSIGCWVSTPEQTWLITETDPG